jgi:hypothetical protein
VLPQLDLPADLTSRSSPSVSDDATLNPTRNQFLDNDQPTIRAPEEIPRTPDSKDATSRSQRRSANEKRTLASWWKDFKKGSIRDKENQKASIAPQVTTGRIFGVPLEESIQYASTNVSVSDGDGASFLYGRIPTIVAKCGMKVKHALAAEAGMRKSALAMTEVEQADSIL